MIVYLHRRNDTGQPFYIGSSISMSRALTTSGRPWTWRLLVRSLKSGWTVEILWSGLKKQVAKAREIQLINHYGISKSEKETALTNRNSGSELVWLSRPSDFDLNNIVPVKILNGARLFDARPTKRKVTAKQIRLNQIA